MKAETTRRPAGRQLQKEAVAFDALVTEQVRLWKTKEAEALRTIEVTCHSACKI